MAELEPCVYNTLLKDNYWRNDDYVTSASNVRCDNNLQRGWYRFQLNGVYTTMLAQCPQITNICGSKYPVWYSGKLTYTFLYKSID